MERIKRIFKSNRLDFLGLCLFLLAVAFGADAGIAMAMADTSAVADPIPDDKGKNTQLPGDPASGGALRDGDLVDPDLDTSIAKFRPYLWPLDTDIRLNAQQQEVKGYEVEHYSSGATVLDFKLTSAISNSTAHAESVKLPVNANAVKTLGKDDTICFPDEKCYDEKGQENGTGLMLQVVEKSNSEIKVAAINGPLNEGEMYVPDIAAEAAFVICANALSESQMLCSPDNYQPRSQIVYLQKSACNIVITDHWKELAKKVDFVEQDIKDDALYNYRRKLARTRWLGDQRKVKRYQGETMKDEYVYFSRGVLRQVNSLYGLNDKIEFEDLIRLTKLQFTDYSASNTARAYCGKNFIEKLLNIDFTKHHDVEFTTEMTIGIDIRKFKTSFGTLEFVHDPTLNDIGYEDYCVILDIKNAKRYYKKNKEYKIDMKKGVGDNREASRDIHIEAECLATKGYNSILVGPSDRLLGKAGTKATIKFTSSATIPTESLTDGMVVQLTAAVGGFNKGDVITYNAATKSWEYYSGEILAA